MGFERFEDMGPSQAPRPFPGKYPTRFLINAIRGPVIFKYQGKLTPQFLPFLYSQFIKKGGRLESLRIVEVDQNGVVLNINGGIVNERATFLPLYSPASLFYAADFSRNVLTYVALDRTVEEVHGKAVYNNAFWALLKTPAIIEQMLDDCVRGRFRQRWLPADLVGHLCYDVLPACVARWLERTPRAVTVPRTIAVPEPPQLAVPAPPRARPRFVREGGFLTRTGAEILRRNNQALAQAQPPNQLTAAQIANAADQMQAQAQQIMWTTAAAPARWNWQTTNVDEGPLNDEI